MMAIKKEVLGTGLLTTTFFAILPFVTGETMHKQFNITGVCIPEKHYMVDISTKINDILKMIELGNYFVINRPRQYGKTTTLYMLNRLLKTSKEYFPIKISFEGIGQEGFQSCAIFIEELFNLLKKLFINSGEEKLVTFIETTPIPDRFSKLDSWIGQLVKKVGKKIVLLIDEVDKSSNNQLFLDFLGMLRNKYLQRDEDGSLTFHSVILAGVHDVKSLKTKLRTDAEAKLNSPWNIATDFEVDLSFFPAEIVSMLDDYAQERSVKIDSPVIAEQIYYYTSGYPFLVSHLCKIFAEEILPQKAVQEWCLDDTNRAAQLLLKKYNTNVESLTTNLGNNPDLYNLVFDVVINQVKIEFSRHNEVIAKGVLYGVFSQEAGDLKIHNRLYEQLIYDYMSINLIVSGAISLSKYDTLSHYLLADGSLDMERVILKFQQFMAEQYAIKDREFIERNGRLLFLTFIKPIINGKGFDFKEAQISGEKRIDVTIAFGNKKYIIELKLWRGEVYHQEGIHQLNDYLDRQHETSGYLLIFDLRKESGQVGKAETIATNGKKILAAWV